jgi:hypothetical protein
LSNAKKNISQSINNMEGENNPKLQTNQRLFVTNHSGPRSRDYILVTKIKSKNLQNLQRKTFNH